LRQLASLNGLEDANVVPGEDLTIVADSDDDLMGVLVLEFDRDIASHLMIVLGENGAFAGDRVGGFVEDVDVEDLVLIVVLHFTDHYDATIASCKL